MTRYATSAVAPLPEVAREALRRCDRRGADGLLATEALRALSISVRRSPQRGRHTDHTKRAVTVNGIEATDEEFIRWVAEQCAAGNNERRLPFRMLLLAALDEGGVR